MVFDLSLTFQFIRYITKTNSVQYNGPAIHPRLMSTIVFSLLQQSFWRLFILVLLNSTRLYWDAFIAFCPILWEIGLESISKWFSLVLSIIYLINWQMIVLYSSIVYLILYPGRSTILTELTSTLFPQCFLWNLLPQIWMWVAAPPSAHSSASPNKAACLEKSLWLQWAVIGSSWKYFESDSDKGWKFVADIFQSGSVIMYLRSGFHCCPSKLLEQCYLVREELNIK